MSDGLTWALRALREFPDLPGEPPDFARWPRSQRRLRDALVGAATGDKSLPTGRRDLVPLVRHVVLAADMTLPVRVARRDVLPLQEDWRAAGCACTILPDHFEVTVREWTPTWLNLSAVAPPARPACVGQHENLPPVHDDGPPADPFYAHATNHTHYRTAGQRIGLQTVLGARAGSTVIANLPTRSGKSALAFVPALLGASRGRTALVVVPTTALALDQERQFLDLGSPLATNAPGVLAFHRGLSEGAKDEMKRRMRDGTQTIIFTSPEGVMGALRAAATDAAAAGRIGLFAIDEAHTVSQWGDDFRPEFQALGGLRRALLSASPAPFTTLLMTGTLTATTLDALVLLFRSAVGNHVVSSVDLRAEPSYWYAHAANATERDARVLEAVHHLPRPLILYTTRVKDADGWTERLREAGYARVETVTGKTPPGRRRSVIQRVRGDSHDAAGRVRTGLDVVVATSAYGLGVDQPDVRTVLHACIPESIDRFYQEVGRGGRDGAPSVSLLVHEPADARTSEKLALTTVIGQEKARKRWEAMWRKRQAAGPDSHLVRTDTIPAYGTANNDYNEQWNLLTLLLMQRARMIDLDVPPPPDEASDDDARAWESLWTQQIVRLVADDLGDTGGWDALERAAAQTHARDRRALGLLMEALDERRSMVDLLRDAYTIHPGDSLTMPELEVSVGVSHGGCPVSRAAGVPPRRDTPPTPRPLRDADATVTGRLGELFGKDDLVTVVYDPPSAAEQARARRMMERVVEGLARAGVRTMVASEHALGHSAVQTCWQFAPTRSVFVASRYSERNLPGTACLLIADHMTTPNELQAFLGARVPRVLIGPSDLPDHERPDRPISDTLAPMSITDFAKAVA